MTHLDNLLEACLKELDQGIPLERIIQRLPADACELVPLLRLAAMTRALPHPTLAADKARKQRSHLVKYAGSFAGSGRKFNLRWALAPLALVISLLLLASIVTIALAGPAGNRYATVIDASGEVEVYQGQEWRLVENGERVRAGQLMRTGTGSEATLMFFEGTYSVLAQDTQVAFETLRGGWNRSLRVVMRQDSGLSSHSVVPLRGANSRYIVETASAHAAVRGTEFIVSVADDGSSRFEVTRGVVEVAYNDQRVQLTAGQATVTRLDQPLAAPAYEFSVQGPIAAIHGDQWTVGGLIFTVPQVLLEDPAWQVGDQVFVRGRILADGSLVADQIDPARNDQDKLKFAGIVEQISTEIWTVSGKLILIDGETEIGSGILAGDPVEVSFVVLENGSWLAKEIQSLDDEEGPVDTEKPTATSLTPTKTPTLTKTPLPAPSRTGTASPTSRPTATQIASPSEPIAGCGVDDKLQPEAVTLAERYNVTYEEIMFWFCQNYGFGEIALAYDLSAEYGTPVEDIFAMAESGLSWGKIKAILESSVTATPKPTNQPKPTDEPRPTKEPKPTKEEKDK